MNFNEVDEKLTNSKHGGGASNLNNTSSKKKCIVSGLIGIVIGGIIFGGIGVAAVTLTAKEIKYTPNNQNFNVTNAEEALNEIYKIAEYEIPADTYFYEEDTEGDSETIVRYRKINDKYFVCDVHGKVEEGTNATDVTSKTLIPYTATSANNLSAGNAGFASNKFILGNGVNNKTFYNDGYNAGITFADGRVNTNSTSYSKGYTDGAANTCRVVNYSRNLNTYAINLAGLQANTQYVFSMFITGNVQNIGYAGNNPTITNGTLWTMARGQSQNSSNYYDVYYYIIFTATSNNATITIKMSNESYERFTNKNLRFGLGKVNPF